MRRVLGFSLSLLALISLSAGSIEAGSSSKTLATISVIVTDNKGNPLAGALVSLLREGAVKQTVKHTLTDRQGKFVAKVTPGRYGIKAIASGFGEVAFNAIDVKASDELVYKFNLEPVGYGNTLPERRRDRDDVKWNLRSAQKRRSIFQQNEGEDPTVQAVNDAGTNNNATTDMTADAQPAWFRQAYSPRTHGVIESYAGSNGFSSGYLGFNFAVSTP